MTTISNVRRYERRVFVLLGLLAIAISGVTAWYVRSFCADITGVRTRWTPDGLSISTALGYPYVVTHLSGVTFAGHGHVGFGCTAVLPRPLVFIDSDRVILTNAEFKALDWVDKRGKTIEAPTIGARVTALYYKPLEGRFEPQRDVQP